MIAKKKVFGLCYKVGCSISRETSLVLSPDVVEELQRKVGV